MKSFRHLLVILIIGAAAAATSYFLLPMRKDASASVVAVPDKDIIPARQTVPAPRNEERLSGLTDRGDGARILWAAEAGQTPLRAAFIDNGSMLISATSEGKNGTTHGFYSVDLATRAVVKTLDDATPKIASDHRPSNKNADKVCYSERSASGAMEIWCRSQSWTKPVRVTTHDGQEDLINPAISPEGGRVIFEVNSDRVAAKTKVVAGRETPGTSSIWIIGLNGAGLRQITRGADDRFPTWSEDGSRILFQRRAVGGSWDMYMMGADGSDAAPVMRTFDEDERWPTRVGGAKTVAAVVGPTGEGGRVKLIDIDTKAGRWMTDAEYGSATDISVSPDGRLISFIAPIDPTDPARLGVYLKSIE